MRDTTAASTGSAVSLLDCRDIYARLDPSGLRHRLGGLARQCREAWAGSGGLSPDGRYYNKIVIGGMGGSAIAGDLAIDLAALQPGVPIMLVRDFSLPLTLDQHSLFIACSFSGSTQETLALFRQAQRQGSGLLAITGGGPLLEEAGAAGVPVLRIEASGEPRSAVGCNLMLLLGALDRLNLLHTPHAQVDEAAAAAQQQCRRCHEEVPAADNPAKQLAQDLLGKLVVVYGGGPFSALARRWKTQLNENAKVWAFFETLPELLHNSVEAFTPAAAGGHDKSVLVLQPAAGSRELESRYRAVLGLLRQAGIPHRVLKGEGESPLAKLLSLLVLGDYVSYYLALLQGLDPSPTPNINRGKELLQEPEV
jgi:glucose/mannose-6-phosphate isomerase